MSDTPKTDAVVSDAWMMCGVHVVSADFARQLERERVQDVNALMEDIRKGDDMLMAWFKAASPYATPGSLEAALRRFHHWEGEMVRLLGIDPKDAGSLPDDVRSRKTDAGHPHRE